MTQDEHFMHLALEEAAKAAAIGEIPVGAVVVRHGEVVAAAHNRRETGKNALAHAECLAIEEACRVRGGWRLWDCELYVTMEPCPMCAGAIINSRIRRVIYAVPDAKAGCCGSVTDLFSLPFNHRPEVTAGVCADECAALVQDFFTRLREELKTRPRWKKPVPETAAQPKACAAPKEKKHTAEQGFSAADQAEGSSAAAPKQEETP
ncbi:MAG: nucleoside deaminase [Oscillospiraceae bacterium]|nr:nucleoside deaminase [Oscillospiraceae bacterium]